MTTSITLNDLYQRQITLIGEAAFEKVRQASILVIGAGGLGCPALQYLASSGIGRIGIVDFDLVGASNLQRQILFTLDDIGKNKATVAAEKLRKLAPFCELEHYSTQVIDSNAEKIISAFDIIMDCTDNFATKFLIHDTCLKNSKVLIQASVYQFEGQMQFFDFRNQSGPCLRCLWTEEPIDGCTGTCEEVGVMGPLLGVMGSLQAMEALKFITNKEHLQNGESLFIDLMSLELDRRRFKQLIDCPCCVAKTFKRQEDIQIELPVRLEDYIILDVRSPGEFKECSVIRTLNGVQSILNVPLEEIASFKPSLGKKYLTVCSKGVRSLKAGRVLRKHHPAVYSLRGGAQSLV